MASPEQATTAPTGHRRVSIPYSGDDPDLSDDDRAFLGAIEVGRFRGATEDDWTLQWRVLSGITKLRGSNWNSWSSMMKTVLQGCLYQRAWAHATGTIASSTEAYMRYHGFAAQHAEEAPLLLKYGSADMERETVDRKTIMLIMSAIEESILVDDYAVGVGNQATAKAVWDYLKARYAPYACMHPIRDRSAAW